MISKAINGALCLVFGWGAGTIIHEMFHYAAGLVLGVPVSFGDLTLTTGSVFATGTLTPTETVIIAAAGGVGIMILGVMLASLTQSPYTRMVGVIFLCRAWIDLIPLAGKDGHLIMSSGGYVLAASLLLASVLVCGGVILNTIER